MALGLCADPMAAQLAQGVSVPLQARLAHV